MGIKKCLLILILGLWPIFSWADRVASYSKVTCLPEEGLFSFEYPVDHGYMEYASDMKEKLDLWEKYGFVEDTSNISDPEGDLEMDQNLTTSSWNGSLRTAPLPLSQQKHVFTKHCPIGNGVTFRIKSYWGYKEGTTIEDHAYQIEIQYGDKMLYQNHEFYRRMLTYPLLLAKLQKSETLQLELELGVYSDFAPHYLMGLKLQCGLDNEILSSELVPFDLKSVLYELDRDHEEEAFPRDYNINCKQLINNK